MLRQLYFTCGLNFALQFVQYGTILYWNAFLTHMFDEILSTIYLAQQKNHLPPQKQRNSLIILYEIQYLKYRIRRPVL